MACTKSVGSAPIAIPDGALYNGDELVIPPSVAPYVKGVLVSRGTARDRIEKMVFPLAQHIQVCFPKDFVLFLFHVARTGEDFGLFLWLSQALDVRKHYQAGELHIVSLIEGARVFTGVLSDFIGYQESAAGTVDGIRLFQHSVRISTYRNSSATGEVIFKAEDLHCLKDKHVLLVDDVVETGNSFKYVLNWLSKFEPKSIRTAALVQIRIKGQMPVVDFTGFTAPMEWLVGFGIDFNGRFREVPHVCVLADSAKKELAI